MHLKSVKNHRNDVEVVIWRDLTICGLNWTCIIALFALLLHLQGTPVRYNKAFETQ